jgi:hypothetical protein
MIAQFLKLLYPRFIDLGEGRSRFTLWTLPNKHSHHLRFSTDHDLEIIEQKAELLDASGNEVYFGVGLRDGAPKGLGFESEVAAWPGFWIDIDIEHEVAHVGVEKKGKSLPPDLDAVEKVFGLFAEKGGVEPTTIVHSGYGVHAYYLFEEPIGVGTRDERKEFKSRLQTFQRQFAAAMDMVGKWHLDPTAKLQQVLRLPGTTNRKVKEDPQTVTILVDDGPRYDLEDLSRVTIRGRGRPPRSDSAGSDSPGSSPPPARTAGASQSDPPAKKDPFWIKEVRKRLNRVTDPKNQELAELLLAGESFAERGGRNDTCNKLCGLVCAIALRVNDEPDVDELYDTIFAESIDAMAEEDDDPNNPALTEDIVKDQIERSIQDLREKKDEHEEIRQRVEGNIQKMLDRGKKTSTQTQRGRFTGIEPASDPATDADDTQEQDQDLGDEVEEDSGPEPGPRRNEEEKPAVDPARMGHGGRRFWIIQFHTSFYIFKDGKYQSAVPKENVEIKLRDDMPFAEWEYENAKGDIKRKTLPQFLLDYCTVARHLVYNLTIDESYYDPERETFVEAVAPIRPIEPEYNEQVDTWLKLLGGNQADKLIDWIATVTDLHRQSCALYLSGESGTGKTMLAHGLAKLWTEHGSPTELSYAIGSFNDSVSKCPLLVADEALPKHCTSAMLREIVGSSSRSMSKKYAPNAPLVGALRLMLLANNERMLQTGEEEQDGTDIEAVAGRILHIKVGPEAADYLRSLGGSEGTRGWVDNSIIAGHALWLAKNLRANFKPGGRFLVEGHKTRVHRLMVINNYSASLAAEWLVKYMLEPLAALKEKRLVIVSREMLLVNAFALTNFWENYVSSARVPTLNRIGRGLTALSLTNGEKRIESKRYMSIDLTLLFEWAEAAGVADAVTMHEALGKLSGPVIVKS